uniref:Uncharacterized protein n=1 Tax=Dicentrarchus labrax TaxID=13489 RepID=A0A8C4GS49_DICLA
MKKTFICDESMIITIPIGSLNGAREAQLMPEKFQCVYKDSYKIFAINGKPKPLGAAQAIAGVFIVILGLIFTPQTNRHIYDSDQIIVRIYSLPSVLFVVSGMLSYASGQSANMHVTKLSFSLNIVSFFWSIAAICMCIHQGINGLILTLLVVENLFALFLIYWLSKAVCRNHFNTLVFLKLNVITFYH